ncbi:MAG: hypothetical protein HUU38_16505 [Anaerolineales bacterium]|nr:hypothetical protein [Anaerolineales bacterium]
MLRFRNPTYLRIFFLVGGTLVFGLLTGFSGWYHPGCLTLDYAVPNPPGLPCLPPTPPPTTGGAPPPETTSQGAKQGPIRLTVINQSELPFSITLTGPQTYVFNVASGETRVFVVTRGAYTFDMMLCALGAQGVLNLDKMTTMQFKSCALEKLVEVTFKNPTASPASITLSGPGNFVFTVLAGETRVLTIPRGEYAVTRSLCGGTETGTFAARSHRTMSLACP